MTTPPLPDGPIRVRQQDEFTAKQRTPRKSWCRGVMWLPSADGSGARVKFTCTLRAHPTVPTHIEQGRVRTGNTVTTYEVTWMEQSDQEVWRVGQ